ncbi:MAG: DUF4175 family protein [Longimicrobiales bacterium]|nr:DUF4175 family protein [Longimicrobiales bacterium]
MSDGRDGDRKSTRLRHILSGVRTRWRLRRTVSGMVWVLLAAIAAAVITAIGLEATRFAPGALLGFRLAAWTVVAVLLLWRVILPWVQRVDDERVALYLEEHEPSLQAAILGAVEAERAQISGTPTPPGLLEALVRRAVERARRIENGRRIDQPGLVRASGVLAFVAIFALGLLLFGPASVQRGASSLLPTASAAELNPYAIAVEPGDLTVARGSDQFITAYLQGFGSDEVTLYRRGTEVDVLQQLTMIPTGTPGAFEILLLGLDEGLEYFVESDGVRSPTYTIDVVDLPWVESMAHEYRWPAWTGIPVEYVESAGDLAVLPGTRVRVIVNSTRPTPAGRIVIDEREPVDLTLDAEGRVVGEFVVRERGYYRIELALADGSFVAASPEYRIDLLTDRRPTLTIEEPGRDTDVSAIEEVYIEARASDDYAIADLKLVYSVNGAAEDTVNLFNASGRPLAEVVAGHTLFLEDFDLEDGDLISFYATTTDAGARTGAPITSDIYFLQVRPFRRDYREAPQQGGQPPGGGGQQPPAEPGLSELQRQVIAATFNLNRDRDTYTDQEFAESTRSVALAQGRVREQVGTLVERMRNRGLANAEESFRVIAEMLPEATAAMDTARILLDSLRTEPALQPEQRALRVLLKAEETYERMVQLQQEGGGGGGGPQGGANADDLADLFELELDKLENQYETVQRGERQEANQEVDELLQELEELARRQQQEAERQRSRNQQQNAAGGSATAEAQRELADRVEEAARQLEQLSRDESDPELSEAARELQDAANSMRRSAANGDNSAAAEAQRALEQLEEARRRLQDNREGRIEEDTQSALDEARALRRQQEAIQERLDDLPTDTQQRREAIREISEEKGEMAAEAGSLERRLRELAAAARQRDAETSQRLAEAANVMERETLANRIQYSRGVVEQRDPGFARIFEEGIRSALEDLESALEEAAEAAGRAAAEEGLERALDEARDLQDATESLARRMGARIGTEGAGEEDGQQGQAEGAQGRAQQGRAARGGTRTGDPDDAGTTPRELREFSGGGAVSGTPQPFTDEEIRQYRREFEARIRDARELRSALQDEGRTDEVRELDAAIEALERLSDPSIFDDLPQVGLLQESLRDNLGRVEFSLRREVRGEASDRAALTGSGEIPSEYRRLVEEYYRALARGGNGGN